MTYLLQNRGRFSEGKRHGNENQSTRFERYFSTPQENFPGIFPFNFFIVTGIALYLPPIYRSEVTILIENQDIPEEYVQSTITTYVNQRIEMITQQVMSHRQVDGYYK